MSKKKSRRRKRVLEKGRTLTKSQTVIGKRTLTIIIAFLLISVLGFTFLLYLFSQFSNRGSIPSKPYQIVDTQYHQSAREAVKKVSSLVPETAYLYEFLVERGVSGFARKYEAAYFQGWQRDDPRYKDNFIFVIVNSSWDKKRAYAGYNNITRVLYIHNEPMSLEWVGIVLSHELRHAYYHLVEGNFLPAFVERDEYIDEEILAHDTEILLADGLSNGAFSEAVKLVIVLNELDYTSPIYDLPISFYEIINAVFRKETTASEISGRSFLFLYALNKLMIEKGGLEKPEEKVALRKWLREKYRRIGYGN